MNRAEFEAAHPGCCHICGWSLSGHPKSQYGPDCPWGKSPAVSSGDLPLDEQIAEFRRVKAELALAKLAGGGTVTISDTLIIPKGESLMDLGGWQA